MILIYSLGQAATSHHLGQNFSKMFDIMFEDPDQVRAMITTNNTCDSGRRGNTCWSTRIPGV